MRISVVIPTYNESGSIASLLDELQNVFTARPHHQWDVVVVDGASTDGTPDIVRKKMAVHKNIYLIEEGEKRGIAAAYMTGIRYVIDTLQADAFMEFDGDGQHDPRDISNLVAKLDEGYDYVIGSRYVEGGSAPEWAWQRKLLSRFGSLYTRWLLEWDVHDATSGFKLTRVKSFVQPKQLLSRHYAYKIHLLSAMIESGARIAEVPITFRNREFNTSKSTWRDIVESLKVTGILRLRTLHKWRLLKIVVLSAIAFGIALYAIRY